MDDLPPSAGLAILSFLEARAMAAAQSTCQAFRVITPAAARAREALHRRIYAAAQQREQRAALPAFLTLVSDKSRAAYSLGAPSSEVARRHLGWTELLHEQEAQLRGATAADKDAADAVQRRAEQWLADHGIELSVSRKPYQTTPMMKACELGDLEICQWLYEVGPAEHITKASTFSVAPMQLACLNGHLLVCEWLYKKGAIEDIRRPCNNGFTPMLRACYNGHLPVCGWLYKMGATEDISKANNYGTTPMLEACYGGHLSVCEWLHEVGAEEDISRANNDGDTPMYRACQEGHLQLCKWLYEVGADNDISRANNDGETPMLKACLNGHLSVCEWLFEMGATEDIRRPRNNGDTPMLCACICGSENYRHLEVCKWLYKVGADEDISRANNAGETPMFAACSNGALPVCKWLFESGAAADIDTPEGRLGLTPMHQACTDGYEDVCRWLVKEGANIMSASEIGDITPLRIACQLRELSICQFLVLNGALASASGGHVDHAAVRRDIIKQNDGAQGAALLEWATAQVRGHAEFRCTVLPGTLSKAKSAQLWKLSSLDDVTNAHLKQLVAVFLGVPFGRELRNARELAEALPAILNEGSSSRRQL